MNCRFFTLVVRASGGTCVATQPFRYFSPSTPLHTTSKSSTSTSPSSNNAFWKRRAIARFLPASTAVAVTLGKTRSPHSSNDAELTNPWLNQNRKLRHLSAISLRNLGMPLPPTKESLRNADADADDDDEDLDLNPAKALERRRRRRRRSSGSLTPAQVQERVAQRRGDVYFTLHSPPDCGQPVYTSEVVPRSMNPDFLLLDLSKHGGPSVSRSGEVAIKVFCNYGNGWIQTVEDEVQLAGLSFLGRVLESCNKRLPENCVVWHLTDGCYAWLEGEPPAEAPGWDANAVVVCAGTPLRCAGLRCTEQFADKEVLRPPPRTTRC